MLLGEMQTGEKGKDSQLGGVLPEQNTPSSPFPFFPWSSLFLWDVMTCDVV